MAVPFIRTGRVDQIDEVAAGRLALVQQRDRRRLHRNAALLR
jgi:hypothetical protein